MYKFFSAKDLLNKSIDNYTKNININNLKDFEKDFINNDNYNIDLIKDKEVISVEEQLDSVLDEMLKSEREFLSDEEYQEVRKYERAKLLCSRFRTTGYLGGENFRSMGCAKSIDERYKELLKGINNDTIYMHDVDTLNNKPFINLNCSLID